ncbi:MAG TPA: hypothetical protein VD908_20435 [Cytophagales bacterium]|nr:hypothetical protein [Cytophagales bacterium]
MKLLDSIIISLAVVLFIIGVHQTFYFKIAASYWLFMLSLSLVLYLKLNRAKKQKEETNKVRKTQQIKRGSRSKSKR